MRCAGASPSTPSRSGSRKTSGVRSSRASPQGGDVLAILEGDLLDVEDEEIERSLEWVVDRELGPVPEGPPPLWVRGGEEDVRLRKSLTASLLALGLAALLLPLVHVPPPDIEQAEVPERIVKFIELDQHRPAPPPPPADRAAEAESRRSPSRSWPSTNPSRRSAAQKPADEPKPVEPPRQRAEQAGILAFRDSFANIAERKPAAKLGAQARVGNTGEHSGPQQRALITSLATGGERRHQLRGVQP